MAATVRNFLRRSFLIFSPVHEQKIFSKRLRLLAMVTVGSLGAFTIDYFRRKSRIKGREMSLICDAVVLAKDVPANTVPLKADEHPKKNVREERFLAFGSVEYDGNVYMTPEDFLESVTETSPRARARRRILSKPDVDQFLAKTPALHKGSVQMFRNLNHRGLISYTEYLFLLCVLTKPQSGFRIAFNMFDTDGNQMVEKREFLVLLGVLGNLLHIKNPALSRAQRNDSDDDGNLSLSKIFLPPIADPSTARAQDARDDDQSTDPERGPQQRRPAQQNIWDKCLRDSENPENAVQDTTLLRHFFGPKGTNELNYQEFALFMDNLQTEVLELEFNEFSRGMATISEVEFAKILMRYTKVDQGEHDEYITRVQERIVESRGIKFDEFKKFFQFLNNLDDFTIAMRFFTFGNKPVSQDEFQRAVDMCVGYSLSPHLLNTLFTMFDEDGDGELTHAEFISIMKDRVHRGVRTHLLKDQTRWEMFRACVKNEMRKP